MLVLPVGTCLCVLFRGVPSRGVLSQGALFLGALFRCAPSLSFRGNYSLKK